VVIICEVGLKVDAGFRQGRIKLEASLGCGDEARIGYVGRIGPVFVFGYAAARQKDCVAS